MLRGGSENEIPKEYAENEVEEEYEMNMANYTIKESSLLKYPSMSSFSLSSYLLLGNML